MHDEINKEKWIKESRRIKEKKRKTERKKNVSRNERNEKVVNKFNQRMKKEFKKAQIKNYENLKWLRSATM